MRNRFWPFVAAPTAHQDNRSYVHELSEHTGGGCTQRTSTKQTRNCEDLGGGRLIARAMYFKASGIKAAHQDAVIRYQQLATFHTAPLS